MSTEAQVEKKLEFGVTYNGPTVTEPYQPHKHTDVLYRDLFREFAVPQDVQPQLALYLPDNTTEVPRSGTVAETRIQPDTTLILRPRGAGGGRA